VLSSVHRAAALIVCVVALACGGAHLGDGDAKRLETQGAGIRTSLEAYFAVHARYPATLREAGLDSAAVTTAFGPWQYRTDSLGGRYGLRVGDYGANGFVLTWDAEHQVWSWDQ
jgi:hypothetical protein